MAKRKAARRIQRATNQFNSDTYNGFAVWQKVIFWLGILSFIHPVYWIVRLIVFLVVQREPLQKRVGFYTMQTYIFGWINAVVLTILLVVLTILAVVGIIAFTWLAPFSAVRSMP